MVRPVEILAGPSELFVYGDSKIEVWKNKYGKDRRNDTYHIMLHRKR